MHGTDRRNLVLSTNISKQLKWGLSGQMNFHADLLT